jgi:hypothetical protein
MVLNRRFALILAIMMLGTVFFTGCDEGEETGLDGGSGITEPSGVAGEEGSEQEGDQGAEDTDPAGEGQGDGEDVDTISGVLKATDDKTGTVTVENQTDGELVLKVNDNSKILKDKAQITFDELEDSIGAEVIVEYDNKTKVVTAIGILG